VKGQQLSKKVPDELPVLCIDGAEFDFAA